MGETKQGLEVVQAADQQAWEQWLERNHDRVEGAWLKFAKKAAPVSTVSYSEALESAICFGWIDGQVARYDENFYLQRFTPRRPRSKWSQVNRDKATALIAAGRIRPAGLRAVESAKADGRWDAAYPAQAAATVPADFERALQEHPEAKAFFETLTGSRRYAFLYRLHNVQREDARSRRIERYIELLSQRRTLE